ncbi:hypothetical protein V2J09_022986, partial [Rumex salicifolius]
HVYSSYYSNPPTRASSSSSRRSCFVFGVELFATEPIVDNGKGKMLENNSENNDNAVPNVALATGKTDQFPNAFRVESNPHSDFFKLCSEGQQEMTGITPMSSVASGSRNGTTRKINVDLFPENAKDLLSTGIFDGVFVAYGGSSREQDKRQFAMIQGCSFLCACLVCNGKEYVSARKLEHHAGYETKHPNSGIYFASGISIFKAVETLRKTPRDELFEAICTISGSLIHEENFEKWKGNLDLSCDFYTYFYVI